MYLFLIFIQIEDFGGKSDNCLHQNVKILEENPTIVPPKFSHFENFFLSKTPFLKLSETVFFNFSLFFISKIEIIFSE